MMHPTFSMFGSSHEESHPSASPTPPRVNGHLLSVIGEGQLMPPVTNDNQITTLLAVLEATVVEDVVYNAIPVRNSAFHDHAGAQHLSPHPGWFTKNQKFIFVGIILLLIGTLSAAVISLTRDGNGLSSPQKYRVSE